MEIRQQLLETVALIRVSGDLDRLSAPALDKVFRGHLDAGQHRLILDLSGCPYVDSAGLATIMTIAGELRDDGLLAIVAPDLSIRRLLQVVGLYEHGGCAIFKVEQEALVALGLASPGTA